MAQYVKAHVSKHAKDRAMRAERNKLIRQLLMQEFSCLSVNSVLPQSTMRVGYYSLGNGSYWKRPMMGSN